MTARRLPPPALLLPALVSLVLMSLGLGACSFGAPPATSASRASQATLAACRERAEDVYVRQNRDLIYANDTSSTPYSAGPSTGLPMHGLSSQFAHQQVIDDCVRNTGPQTLRGDGPTPPAAGAAAPGGPAATGAGAPAP